MSLVLNTGRKMIKDATLEFHGDGAGNEVADIYYDGGFDSEYTFDTEELETVEKFFDLMEKII